MPWKPEWQRGFKLSLRGEDADLDFTTLTRAMLARRVDQEKPDQSLLLLKAIGQVPHEGGTRFARTSSEAKVLHNWIAAGCKKDPADLPTPSQLLVTPRDQVVVEPENSVKLQVQARFSDGSQRDVLNLASFETNNLGVARVSLDGTITRESYGEVVVLVRYAHLQVPVRLAFIPDRKKPDFSQLVTDHPVDKAILARLASLRITPSEVASDSVFLRRAFLDACGITPTAQEVERFLADTRTDKRSRWIDQLLERPEFATYWAQEWSDLLRNEEKSLDRKGVQVFHRWIRNWIAEDKPLNDFARAIVTGRGNTYENPAANFYRAIREPYARAESVAQVFLGLRVGCARCHNHPFDRWTQDDYHRFSALFARIDYRIISNTRKDELDKHEFAGDQVVFSAHAGELAHPRGGNAVPRLLGGSEVPGNQDRLTALGDWIAHPDNPFFARAQVNRVWTHLFGRGLVDPNDDFRASNPPSNPELLDHLTREFAAGGYRLKPIVRHIMNSRTYQLSATANESNLTDETHFSRAQVQPLEAEQLLDAVARLLDVAPALPGYPRGMRAGEMPASPQNGRRGTESRTMRFLKVFGKPDRLLTCECERNEDPGTLQAFQLVTGELIHGLLKDPSNRIGQRLAAKATDEALLTELYLTALARKPSLAESKPLLELVSRAKGDEARRAAWEDIAWGLLNSKEFLLRR